MRYYDPQKNWRKLKPHIASPDVQIKLYEDMLLYTKAVNRRDFTYGDKPSGFEIGDWRETCNRKGRHPAYWDYVCARACHWLVNFNLMLAMRVEPKNPWRIITSEKHSTVWDGRSLLFDLNFHANGVTALECFQLADDTRLRPGVFRKTNSPEPTMASLMRQPK
jgi:hypothetical protein